MLRHSGTWAGFVVTLAAGLLACSPPAGTEDAGSTAGGGSMGMGGGSTAGGSTAGGSGGGSTAGGSAGGSTAGGSAGGSTGGGSAGGSTAGGSAGGGAASCTPGTPTTCETPTSLRECSQFGTVSIGQCQGGQACVATDGGASCRCVRQGRLGCSVDDDVYEFDSCGTRLLPRIQDCVLALGERCLVEEDRARCGRPTTCGANGSGCAQQDYCSDGGCFPDVCDGTTAIGSRPTCYNNQVAQCLTDGSRYNILDPCVNGEVCVVLGGTPWAECRCTNNARRGCDSNAIYNFNSCGVRGSLSTTCGSAATCVEGPTGPACVPNVTCTADVNCSTGSICEAGLCVPRVCTPGTSRCTGNDVERCDARGSGYVVVSNCSGGAVCTAVGSSASCTCTPNASLGCSLGDIYQFDSCGNRGARQTDCTGSNICIPLSPPICGSSVNQSCLADSECGTGFICVDGRCGPRVCAPNSTFCASGAVRRCDSRGAESQLLIDCAEGETCTQGSSGASCVCTPRVRQGCSGNAVYSYDSCGVREGLLTNCTSSQVCVEFGTQARCLTPTPDAGSAGGGSAGGGSAGGGSAGGGSAGGGATCTPNARIDCYAGDRYSFDSCGRLGALVEDCRGRILCWELDGGMPECRSSVQSPQSPFYEVSCQLTQQVSNPTTLDADCRCTDNRAPTAGIQRCVGSTVLNLTTRFGSGPSIRSLPQSHYNGGVIIGREVFLGYDWSSGPFPDQGGIMAINLDTGNRRLVSGAYEDPATGLTTTGTGPAFGNVIDVKVNAAGTLFALSVPDQTIDLSIFSVDPATGNRTRLWRGRDPAFGQCASGDPMRVSVSYHDRVFGLSPTGEFYLAFRGGGFTSEGIGLVRIAANGQSCSFVTRSGAGSLNAYALLDIGQGFTVDRGNYAGLSQTNGQLYVLHDTMKALFRIDPVTGNRTRVSSAGTAGGILGNGPINLGGIGERWSIWDAQRNLMWTGGVLNYRTLVAVDLTTGDRTQTFCGTTGQPDLPNAWRNICLSGVMQSGYQNFGGMFLDPVSQDLFIVHDNHSLSRVDVRNGNSMRFSQ